MSFLIKPYESALDCYKQSLNCEQIDTSPSICKRISLFVEALLLSIPIINIVIHWAIKYFSLQSQPLIPTGTEAPPPINGQDSSTDRAPPKTNETPRDLDNWSTDFLNWSYACKNPHLTEPEIRALVHQGIAKNYLLDIAYMHGENIFILLCMADRRLFVQIILEEVQKKGEDALQRLLEHQQLSDHKNTALTWAIANANHEVAELILRTGKKNRYVNVCSDTNGNAAIHLVVAKGARTCEAPGRPPFTPDYLTLLQLLIDSGADLNLKELHGWTPLHIACLKHDIPMIRILLNAGANKELKDSEGRTPKNLLEIPYDEAEQLVHSVASPGGFLSQEHFNQTKAECIALLEEC